MLALSSKRITRMSYLTSGGLTLTLIRPIIGVAVPTTRMRRRMKMDKVRPDAKWEKKLYIISGESAFDYYQFRITQAYWAFSVPPVLNQNQGTGC
jgi:hypothetical protein